MKGMYAKFKANPAGVCMCFAAFGMMVYALSL